MRQVTLDEARSQLSDLIDEALHGADVIITRNNEPVIKLVPLSSVKPRPQFGSARGLIHMSEDFDDPLEDFEDYR